MARRKSKLRSLGIKKQEPLLALLRGVADTATMTDSYFGEHTALIKDQTDLWRRTWIIGPLERAIKIIESNGADAPHTEEGK